MTNQKLQYIGKDDAGVNLFFILLVVDILSGDFVINLLSRYNLVHVLISGNLPIFETLLATIRLLFVPIGFIFIFNFFLARLSTSDYQISYPRHLFLSWKLILSVFLIQILCCTIFYFSNAFLQNLLREMINNDLTTKIYSFILSCISLLPLGIYIEYFLVKNIINTIEINNKKVFFSITYGHYLINSIKSFLFVLTIVKIPKSVKIFFGDNFVNVVKNEDIQLQLNIAKNDLNETVKTNILRCLTIIGIPKAKFELCKYIVNNTEIMKR